MPDSRVVGERLAAIETSIKMMQDYEKEHWHKLNNDLTPIMMLPDKLQRELKTSLAPLVKDIEQLQKDVTILKGSAEFMRMLKSPFLASILSAVVTVALILIAYFKGVGK